MGFDPADGVSEQFGGGLELELGFDIGAVDFDSFVADVKFVRHLQGGEAFANQLENFKFAIGQCFDG